MIVLIYKIERAIKVKEIIEEAKENWLYYLGTLVVLLFMAGLIAFVIFVAFLAAISVM